MWLIKSVLVAVLAQSETSPDALVRRLGSDDFSARESAEAALSKLGLAALAAIEAGGADADPEVRRRCRDLSLALRKQNQIDMLTRFVAGSDNLPGWERFRKVLGQRPDARKAYAEIYGSDPTFIDDVESRPQYAPTIIVAKVQLLQTLQNAERTKRGGFPFSTNDVAIVMFAAQHPQARIPTDKLHFITSMLYNQNIQNSLSGRNGVAVNENLRAIVVSWMLSQTDINAQMQSLYICMNNDLKDGITLARSLLKNGNLPPHGRGVCCSLLGRLGNKDNIPDLVPLLSDTTHMNNFQVRPKTMGVVQVRDVALAMLVHITGQSHKDYSFGFTTVGQPFQVNSTYNMGFLEDAKRQEALAKWDAYAKANGLPPAKR
ncbi:MAG: hypothetical protein FJ261_14325 [Planctomycetes bacterium]|nr:hypothetical protein [Planctomycetota bacterium]